MKTAYIVYQKPTDNEVPATDNMQNWQRVGELPTLTAAALYVERMLFYGTFVNDWVAGEHFTDENGETVPAIYWRNSPHVLFMSGDESDYLPTTYIIKRTLE